MASLFGLGRKKENEADNDVRNDARDVTSGRTGTGSNQGYSGRGDTASEEARNMNYEGSTASGARSGATGSTSALAGQNTGSNSGYQSGNTGNTSSNTGYQSGTGGGSGSGSGNRGTTGTTSTTTGNRGVGTGITEGFAGLNITHRSGFDTNHPIVGDTNIVCDTKYYTAVEDRPVIKEIKTYIREHHPIEKEFVVETRPTGQEREQVQGRTQEVVDTKERVVETTKPDPCGGVPTTEYASGYTGATGRGATSGTGYSSSTTTGSTGTGAGAGYGTSSGATGTGAGYGSSSGTGAGAGGQYGSSGTGSGTGSGARTIT